MSDLQHETVKLILNALLSMNITLHSFVNMAISTENPLSRSFLNGGVEILLDNLLENDLISVTVSNWITSQAIKLYKKEISDLTSKENGFHFLTAKMTQKQLQNFDVEDLMKRMMAIAPDLWRLVETLHAGNSRINDQRAWTQKKLKKVHGGKGEGGHRRKGPEGDIEMADIQTVWELDDDDEEYLVNDFELIGDEDDEPEDIQEQEETHFEARARIVS